MSPPGGQLSFALRVFVCVHARAGERDNGTVVPLHT